MTANINNKATVTFTIRSKEADTINRIIERIAKEYDPEILCNYGIDGTVGDNYISTGQFQTEWYLSDHRFFSSLAKENPGTIIEIDSRNENQDSYWRARFLNDKCEEIDVMQKYSIFKKILTDSERKRKKMTVTEKLDMAIELIQSIRTSGYIPCSSPCPSSTEYSIRKLLDHVNDSLETVLAQHKSMYL